MDIRQSMPIEIESEVYTSRYSSRGFFKRLYNAIAAFFYQGDVNHITGDVHYLTFFLKKSKTILTIHDCATLERLSGIRWIIFFYIWFWIPEKRVSIITVISESTKKELLRFLKCDPNKIKVVSDCVSEDFKPAPRKFSNEKPTILQIGTGKNKNIQNIAKSLINIPCHLRIVGKLDLDQIQALDTNLIEFSNVSGITDDQILTEFKDCDMLVFTSTYEGFGLPILEANATGRPVVTSNIYSMPEVAGEAACLVDPFSPKSIRNGILRIINNEDYRQELVAAGYENVKRFRPEAIALEYVKLYKMLNH